jgi:hypothetical protein
VPAPAFQTKGVQSGKQHTPEELEELRAKFLEFTDTVQQFTDLVSPETPELSKRLADARTQFEHFTPKELNIFRATMDPAQMNARLDMVRAALDEYRPILEPHRQRVLQNMAREKDARASNGGAFISSANLPDRDGPDAVCDALIGSGRPTAALEIAADAVYFIAEGIHAASDRSCNEVVVVVTVIAGEGGGGGGNTSLACVAADALLIVAKVLREKVSACDDDFTKRTVDAAFNRLGHLDSQLDGSIANDNTNTATLNGAISSSQTAITTNDNANKNTIVANDNANKNTITTAISNSQGAIVTNANGNTAALFTAITNAQTAIVTNDNANKNTIVANDNANKNTIVANDNANTSTLLANANANAAMLRDLILRTQIEADLSSTDGATFVAIYLTPAIKGGYFELARSIVTQTIANIGGASTSQANALLAKGDAAAAAGDYKSAYAFFRQAYKKAEGQ